MTPMPYSQERERGGWNPTSNGQAARLLQTRARDIALDIATKLQDPCKIEHEIAISLHQAFLPSHGYWAPFSLSQGYAGLSLTFAHFARCFPEQHWGEVALKYFELAVSGAVIARDVPMGGLTGMAGLFFAGGYLADTLGIEIELNVQLERKLINLVQPCLERITSRRGVSVSDVDVISGLSGVVAALHTYGSAESRDCNFRALGALIGLSKDDDGLPNLHSPVSLANPDDSIAKQLPQGFVNCGLAHGIPGPLVALSIAALDHPDDPFLASAVTQLAGQLYSLRGSDRWGVNWPAAVGLDEYGPARVPQHRDEEVHTRTAWCYGNPGVSRSLCLAGVALNSSELQDAALSAIRSALQRPLHAVASPTFCHGMAGLLQIALRFASEQRAEDLVDTAQACAARLIDMFDVSRTFGYCSIEMGNQCVDQPGLLDGAAGVALALLSFSEPRDPGWDRIFCIS
jgi:lantibiotic modifying enzyme